MKSVLKIVVGLLLACCLLGQARQCQAWPTDETGQATPAVDAKAPPVHAAFAVGKVLAVERHGDRFAVEISIGADHDLQSGLQTRVYVVRDAKLPAPGKFPRKVVARGQIVDVRENEATCNIGPRSEKDKFQAPQPGDTVFARRKHVSATFVLAKNVVVHDGRIMDWTDVPARLAELNERGPIAASLRVTRAVYEQRKEREKEFDRWCEAATGRSSYSIGWMNSSDSKFYDTIEKSQRVLRDASRRRIGRVVAKGSPVANAEVVVCTLGEEFTHLVYLEHGRLRDPYDEPTRTLSELNGKFDVFPDSDRFQLLVLHESGFALVTSDSWPKQPDIELTPWAQITGKFDGPREFDELAHFESRQHNPGFAELRLEIWNTPLHADRSFQNRMMPPGEIIITRTIKSPLGGGTGIRHGTVELKSGESRHISIGALSDVGRKKAKDYLRREGVLQD